MKIDEAVKHCEEVAIEQDKLCKRYDDASGYSRSHNEAIRTTDAKGCEECAKEHRQLAEWLKDYKRLLEQQPDLDKIIEEIEDNTYFINEITEKEGIDFETVEKIIDKYKQESEVEK